MAKTSISGLTCKLPAAFSQEVLDERIAAKIEHYEYFNQHKQLRGSALFELLMQLEAAVLEGRKFVMDERHGVSSMPFICCVTKLPEEIEEERQRIAKEVEEGYRAEIVNALAEQKEILIAQRLAELKAKEEAEQAKKEAKLLAQLEAEADAVLAPSLYGL